MYNKNAAAPLPPMGWNSYDYYNTAVTEADVRANADYMAEHLAPYGWQYVVVDIQWSDPNAGALVPDVQYVPFTQFCVDDWSRQIPAPNRFPSSAGGAGFKPLADYVHSLGLKFGIHIMRGIPRICAHNHTPILGCDVTADKIANPFSISKWNGDMYGVDMTKPGAQAYYDSIFALYASWGVDFVKVDDIANTNMYAENPYSAQKEIEAIARAIERSGRAMVLSLSPGPAVIEKAWHLEQHANMWRITDDFWDDWRLLRAMFERCEVWQKHVGAGCWPDCDMLPLGRLGKGFGAERGTNFTEAEQRTMLTLWCIFRSPLMIGAELTKLDDATLALLTNREVLRVLTDGRAAAQVRRDEASCVWKSYGAGAAESAAGGDCASGATAAAGADGSETDATARACTTAGGSVTGSALEASAASAADADACGDAANVAGTAESAVSAPAAEKRAAGGLLAAASKHNAADARGAATAQGGAGSTSGAVAANGAESALAVGVGTSAAVAGMGAAVAHTAADGASAADGAQPLYVALFNLDDSEAIVSASRAELALGACAYRVRDLWAQRDLAPLPAARADCVESTPALTATLPAHGAALLCLQAQ